MTKKSFLLTFDWVVNYLIQFNQSKTKKKDIMRSLKYIFKLEKIRGYDSNLLFFNQLCRSNCLKSDIIKNIQKLSEFVSVEEMKTLLVAENINYDN